MADPANISNVIVAGGYLRAPTPPPYVPTVDAPVAFKADPYFSAEGLDVIGSEAPNLVKNSEDMTDSSWVNTRVHTVEDLGDGWFKLDNQGDGIAGIYHRITKVNTDQDLYQIQWKIKKTTLDLSQDMTLNFGNQSRYDIRFVSSTGNATHTPTGVQANNQRVQVLDGGDHWVYVMYASDSTTLGTWVDFQVYADRFQVGGGIEYPVVQRPIITKLPYPAPYTPTTGEAVITDGEDDLLSTLSDKLKGILDNGVGAGEGTLAIDYTPRFSVADLPQVSGQVDYGVVSVQGNHYGPMYLQHNPGWTPTTAIKSYDQTNISDLPAEFLAINETYTFVTRWSTSENVSQVGGKNGDVWTWDPTPNPFDGAYTLGTYLELLYANNFQDYEYPVALKNLRFWDFCMTQAQVEEYV